MYIVYFFHHVLLFFETTTLLYLVSFPISKDMWCANPFIVSKDTCGVRTRSSLPAKQICSC